MKEMFLVTAIAAVMVVGPGAEAAQLPIFELGGFPISPHQVAVLGATGVREQASAPTLMFRGMPASPHQIAVLTPRLSITSRTRAAKPTTVGFSAK